MPKVSILVPVYGVEACLDKCVESVLKQTYSDWELLLVDDGSPDRSGAICDEWAKRDKRIKVFHKENGGVSSARNMGLDNLLGEWIMFIDADDAVTPDTLSTCSQYFDVFDIVLFSMKYVYSKDGAQTEDYILPVVSREEYISRIVSRKTILGVCGGIYRARIFKENNIRFDENLINGEDWLVLTNLMLAAKDAKILPLPFYLYNKTNESSCTSSINFKKSYSAICALSRLIEVLNNYMPNKYSQAISMAKCELGYDFYAGVALKSYSLNAEDIKMYTEQLCMTWKDIHIGSSSFKNKLFLIFAKSIVGQFYFSRIALHNL